MKNKQNKNQNNQLTVAALRKSGHKVRVIHQRRFIPVAKLKSFIDYPKLGEFDGGRTETQNVKYKISARGGLTTVEVDTKEGKNYKAAARVSNKDFYNRGSGLIVCLGRIQSQIIKEKEYLEIITEVVRRHHSGE